MKHATATLTGALLDQAVAMALGVENVSIEDGRCIMRLGEDPLIGPDFVAYEPSKNWAAAGPLIQEHRIDVWYDHGAWFARCCKWDGSYDDAGGCGGPTPLVAAMRALVCAKLGEEVDL